MKKIYVMCLAGLLGCAAAWAQFQEFQINNVPDNRAILLTEADGLQGVDYVFVIYGPAPDAELAYIGLEAADNINWYEYGPNNLNPTLPFMQHQKEVSVECGHGYICEVAGERQYIWLVQYVTPVVLSFEPALDNDFACETTIFNIAVDEETNLRYYSSLGAWQTIKRECSLQYNTKEYPEGGDDWADKQESVAVSLPATRFSVPASLDPATTFTLTGDQFIAEWNDGLKEDDPDRIPPYEFTATASPDLVFPVKSHLTSIMTVRDALNEISRPSEAEPTPPIKGSSPLEILFESRPSDPNNTLYDWKIYKGDALLLTRTDEDLRYTFEDFGTYYVKLEVYRDYMNGTRCSMRDSVEVSVSESFLGVPNVFTPNGDGKNDEFRVAYRSLRSFHCWVYSSWGKLVYEWSDPAKGWDGRVNGRKNAPTGTYFYIIKAEGTDGVKHNRKGDINIIR